MRPFLIFVCFSILLLSEINGQEKKRELDVTFSYIHPAKWGLNEYLYSFDPKIEVLYHFPISNKGSIAVGILAQKGTHNWKQLTGHTFYDDLGGPYSLRTDFDRQLEFISLGIPIQIEIKTDKDICDAFFLKFSAGNHIKLEMADYFKSDLIATFDAFEYFNNFFWDINTGFKKNLIHNRAFALSLVPVAGLRSERSLEFIGIYDYFYYGLGLSARFKW